MLFSSLKPSSEHPLRGLSVLLPREEPDRIGKILEDFGANVIYGPLTRILPNKENIKRKTWKPVRTGHYKWIVFTSSRSIKVLEEHRTRIDRILLNAIQNGSYIAAVGPSTKKALQAYNLRVELIPFGSHSAAGLLEVFPEAQGPNRNVLIPGSALSSGLLTTGLSEKGYQVDTLPLYTSQSLEELPQNWREELEAPGEKLVLLTAGSVARAGNQLIVKNLRPPAVALGGPSGKAGEKNGWEVLATSASTYTQDLLKAFRQARYLMHEAEENQVTERS